MNDSGSEAGLRDYSTLFVHLLNLTLPYVTGDRWEQVFANAISEVGQDSDVLIVLGKENYQIR